MPKFVDLTNEQTYKVVDYILNHREFNQKEICKTTGVSKGWVSKVVTRIAAKDYIAKAGKNYRLKAPTALISLFPLFRSMPANLLLSKSIDAYKVPLFKFLARKKVVYCTTSALQLYSSYFRDPSINIYSEDKELLDEFKKMPEGMVRINVYKPDLPMERDVVKHKKKLLTSEIRTVIDLFCDNKAYAAEELIRRLWK